MTESDRLSDRFRELLEYLGSQMGSARGWKQEVAGRVGIHPTHMSKVLAGTRSIQWSTAVEAAERLGLDLAYFNGSGSPSEYMHTGQGSTVQPYSTDALRRLVDDICQRTTLAQGLSRSDGLALLGAVQEMLGDAR